jgi:hypothetical protein
MKIEFDTIIKGLQGMPITELVEDWSFTIEEIAPYVFKAQGEDIEWHMAVGYGGTAEEALKNCSKRAKRINWWKNRGKGIQKMFSRISNEVEHIIGRRK